MEQLLQDSVGLAPDASVETISLRSVAGAERASPDSVAVTGAIRVDFRSDDGRPRNVVFELDSLTPAARSFLLERAGQGSPPLLGDGVHWVVDFEGAPAGRYPYRVEGTGDPGRGLLIVVVPTG